MKTKIILEGRLYFWRTLAIVLLTALLSLMSCYASDWTDNEHFSASMEQAMMIVEMKMQETEDCYRAIETRNELLCTIWKRNIYIPFTGFH